MSPNTLDPAQEETTTLADYRPSQRQLAGTAVVLALGAVGVATIDALNDWVGDLGALLWTAAGFWFPFIAGIVIKERGAGIRGRVIGALVGAAVVALPIAGYLLVRQDEVVAMRIPLSFIPLALAQGAIAMPVGASVRSRKPWTGR